MMNCCHPKWWLKASSYLFAFPNPINMTTMTNIIHSFLLPLFQQSKPENSPHWISMKSPTLQAYHAEGVFLMQASICAINFTNNMLSSGFAIITPWAHGHSRHLGTRALERHLGTQVLILGHVGTRGTWGTLCSRLNSATQILKQKLNYEELKNLKNCYLWNSYLQLITIST